MSARRRRRSRSTHRRGRGLAAPFTDRAGSTLAARRANHHLAAQLGGERVPVVPHRPRTLFHPAANPRTLPPVKKVIPQGDPVRNHRGRRARVGPRHSSPRGREGRGHGATERYRAQERTLNGAAPRGPRHVGSALAGGPSQRPGKGPGSTGRGLLIVVRRGRMLAATSCGTVGEALRLSSGPRPAVRLVEHGSGRPVPHGTRPFHTTMQEP